ncbi:MAG: hypothetical protein NUV37_00485 [Nanoarchaeota archaeon]|nr:hypothetical protein [Nanoarchaeota archaeon]
MKTGFNKRGQNIFAGVVVGILIIFAGIFLIGWFALEGGTAEKGMNLVSELFMTILGPIFKAVLGLDQTGQNNAFLMVLTFLLASIVIVSTLDSVNIFGESKAGHLANFFVGIIVAIIGVRFMPKDLWMSLTSPASAFIATLLIGLPFLAMFFITMKIRSRLANKVIWLVYFAFLSYLIATGTFGVEGAKATLWVYIIFAVLSLLMFWFDATFRRLIYKERADLGISKAKGSRALAQINTLTTSIEAYQNIIANPMALPADKVAARKHIKEIEKTIRELSGLKN